MNTTVVPSTERHANFLKSLATFSKDHRAAHWSGTFGAFLESVFPKNPTAIVRSSHQYIWDMIRAEGIDDDRASSAASCSKTSCSASTKRSSGSSTISRPRAAGSEVGRRLLLLLGPPSGGKSSSSSCSSAASRSTATPRQARSTRIQGCPVHESPLHLVPAYVARRSSATPTASRSAANSARTAATRLEHEFYGDFMQMPVERIFISEAGRVGIGTYAPHDPTTADLADLVGSVDLSKVARVSATKAIRAPGRGRGAVYAASRGMLEMIEILKVKREFLYLLLTLTQEKNVKVSRFPLIYLDETILAHTNLAEFRKFLQERKTRRCSTAWSSSRCRTRCITGKKRASTRSSFPRRAGVSRRAPRPARAARSPRCSRS